MLGFNALRRAHAVPRSTCWCRNVEGFHADAIAGPVTNAGVPRFITKHLCAVYLKASSVPAGSSFR